jgi:broad specificity phosphatase PhoE
LETQKRIISWWGQQEVGVGEFAVVTHDNIICILVAHVLGLNLNNIWRFAVLPTAVTILENDSLGSRLFLLNDSNHLGAKITDVSAHAL